MSRGARPGSPTAAPHRLQESGREWCRKAVDCLYSPRTCYFLLERKKKKTITIVCAAPRAEPRQRDASANGHVHTQRRKAPAFFWGGNELFSHITFEKQSCCVSPACPSAFVNSTKQLFPTMIFAPFPNSVAAQHAARCPPQAVPVLPVP